MKEKLKQTKGITLIALVITIIILLILATVTIRAIQGDKIIKHAEDATSKYSKAQEEEKVNLAVSDAKMTANGGAITYENLNTALSAQFPNGIEWTSTTAPFSFTVKNGTGEIYTISDSGNITAGGDGETVPQEMTEEEKTAWDAQTSEAYFVWDGTTITGYNSNCPETLIIPTKCTAITRDTYSKTDGSDNVKTVKIPSSVKTITKAFGFFSNLESVEFYKPTITEIGDYAFAHCYKLNNVVIPDTVTNIGAGVFMSNTSLSNITMSKNISKCANNILIYTKWLDSQSEGPVYLGNIFLGYKGAFPENYELTIKPGTKLIASLSTPGNFTTNIKNIKKITIPNSVVYIEKRVFYTLTSNQKIIIEQGSTLSKSSENYPWGLGGSTSTPNHAGEDVIQWP